MGDLIMNDLIFTYDDSQSYKGNFYRWFAMNTKEKELWGDFREKCGRFMLASLAPLDPVSYTHLRAHETDS